MTSLSEVDGPLKRLPRVWRKAGEPSRVRAACDALAHAEARRSVQVYGSVPGLRRAEADGA